MNYSSPEAEAFFRSNLDMVEACALHAMASGHDPADLVVVIIDAAAPQNAHFVRWLGRDTVRRGVACKALRGADVARRFGEASMPPLGGDWLFHALVFTRPTPEGRVGLMECRLSDGASA